MKQIQKIVSRGLVVGGLLTAGGSSIDALQNTALNEELAAKNRIEQELREEKGIRTDCAVGFGNAVCFNVFEGNSTQEEKQKILSELEAEKEKRFQNVPSDPEANKRGMMDGFGVIGGLFMTAAGMGRKGSKERG